jgi:DNA polymerase III epsilon subunit-like protein
MGTGDDVKLCFIDTETTSLRPDRRAWEIAVILRCAGQPDDERSWFTDVDDLDLGNADLTSLRIGRFFDRHPQYRDDRLCLTAQPEYDVLREVEEITRGAHLIGAVPSFDADVLGTRMRALGICPSWHYHLQDFETLIAGYLAGQGKPVPALPWRSDDLSRLIGVEPPGEEERHTAVGDARWAVRVWDMVLGSATEPDQNIASARSGGFLASA